MTRCRATDTRATPFRWCLISAATMALIAVAILTSAASNARAKDLEDFKSCWDTVKSSVELHAAIGERAAELIEDPLCTAHYSDPVFLGLTAGLSAMRNVGGPDCADATADKAIAAVLAELNIPLLAPFKAEIQAIAAGEANKALKDIPGLQFFGCACKLSSADEDVKRFILKTHEVLQKGKKCGEAIGEAVLAVPGLLGQGIGFITDLLGSIPGVGEVFKFAADLVKGLACSNPVSGGIFEAFGGECEDPPDPKDKLKDHLSGNVEKLCSDASLTDEEIAEMAKKAGAGFADKCKSARNDKRDAGNRAMCEGTGGWWVGGIYSFCSCPPGKAHSNWCEPDVCPAAYERPVIK